MVSNVATHSHEIRSKRPLGSLGGVSDSRFWSDARIFNDRSMPAPNHFYVAIHAVARKGESRDHLLEEIWGGNRPEIGRETVSQCLEFSCSESGHRPLR